MKLYPQQNTHPYFGNGSKEKKVMIITASISFSQQQGPIGKQKEGGEHRPLLSFPLLPPSPNQQYTEYSTMRTIRRC
jgi:hypothetical protein